MSSIAVDMVIQKFEILPDSAKREVADFIDFLLQKKFSREKEPDKVTPGNFSMDGRRHKSN